MSADPEKRNNRISLPSKGRLAEDCLDFLEEAGQKIYKPNTRQYEATIPDLPGGSVIFQCTTDIVSSVQDGSIDFGITGYDVVSSGLTLSDNRLCMIQSGKILESQAVLIGNKQNLLSDPEV